MNPRSPPKRLDRRTVFAALLAFSSGCASRPHGGSGPHRSIILFRHTAFLGTPRTVDHLAYGFLMKGEAQPGDFGHYIYLVFRPGASLKQKRIAAQALLGYEDHREFLDQVERERLALLGVPVTRARVPQNPDELIRDYDGVRADIIARAVERARPNVPLVALVAYPEPIERETKVDNQALRVAEVCGSPDQVQIKFRQLRDALVTGKKVHGVLDLAALIGRFFLTGSTASCQ